MKSFIVCIASYLLTLGTGYAQSFEQSRTEETAFLDTALQELKDLTSELGEHGRAVSSVEDVAYMGASLRTMEFADNSLRTFQTLYRISGRIQDSCHCSDCVISITDQAWTQVRLLDYFINCLKAAVDDVQSVAGVSTLRDAIRLFRNTKRRVLEISVFEFYHRLDSTYTSEHEKSEEP